MLPEFPLFKSLELGDKCDVEEITHDYPPYSDFNFASLWSWDIKGDLRISILNDNLVVRFPDFNECKPFYSFLGNNRTNETAEILLKLSEHEGLQAELSLLPEESIEGIDPANFSIREDRDNFDYVYDIEELRTFQGGKFAKKRNQVSLFLRKHEDAAVRVFDLKDEHCRSYILRLLMQWVDRKVDKVEVAKLHEDLAAMRLLLSTNTCNLVGVGVFIDEQLVGFVIDELTDSDYVVAHFSHTDRDFVGVNSFLMRENAAILASLGKGLFNFEQDLGVANLRDAKLRFRPSTFLKKYQVRYRQTKAFVAAP